METPPDGTDKKFQRRTVLVKRSLQLKYMGVVFASVLLATLLVGGDIYYTMYRIMAWDNPSLTHLLRQVHSMVLVKTALYLGIVGLLSLFISHRFAGPIYRFEKSAQAVAGGDLTHRVSLRTGDDLLELQEEFNSMVSNLQSLVRKDRTLALRAAARLDAIRRNLPEDPAVAQAREELLSLKAELEHITAGFKA